MAAAITSISKVLNNLIANQDSIYGEQISTLSDAARLLCDVYHENCVTRRSLILPGLNKDMKELMEQTPISEYLFGDKFSSIKARPIPTAVPPSKWAEDDIEAEQSGETSSNSAETLTTTEAPAATPGPGTSLAQVQTGRLQYFSKVWNAITTNPTIHDWVKGYKLPLNEIPVQTSSPRNNTFSQKESNLISIEINKLLQLGAIKKCLPIDKQYLSSIFLHQKSDGTWRLILNLKN